MKSLFVIVALILGYLLATPASAGDLITSREMFVDASEALSIQDVAADETTRFRPTPIIRLGGSSTWVRLRVRAPAEGGKVVLFIRPPFLTDIRLYQPDPAAPGGWKSRASGTGHPYAERDRHKVSLGFVIDAVQPEQTVYLWFKGRHFTTVSLEALTPLEAEQKDFDRDLLVVFFVTTMSALFLWAVHSYFLDRQKVFAFFALHQLTYTLFGVSATGYLAPLIPARYLALTDILSGTFYTLIGLTITLFCRELLKSYNPTRPIRWGFWVLIALFTVNCLAFLAGHHAPATLSNVIATKLMLLFFVIATFNLQSEGTPRRKLIQILFLFILVNNLAFWIPAYLDISATIFKWTSIQVLFVDGFLIACLFAVIAYVRARTVRREAAEAAKALAIINRNLQEEIERKDQAETQARTDFLTGLFNRRHFFELAQRELERSTRYRQPFTLLMIDIDWFKQINDTWGHGCGDTVLCAVARLLRNTLRSVDIFGRTGGEEFAAVIVETDEAEAVEIAHRVREAVETCSINAPDGSPIRVTVSIGITHLRGRDLAFERVMDEADQAMYAAKKTGRNRIMVNA